MQQLKDKKIVIVGLGLIGGSVARALAELDAGCEIVALGRREEVLRQAITEGSITSYTTDTEVACADADLIILAVPVLSIEAQLRLIAPALREDTIVTDVASVKHTVVQAAINVFGAVPATFVPGHPIAGSEQSGYGAARADLFRGRKVILTPLDHTLPEATGEVRTLWELIGAQVLEMPVGRHDEVLAATSHLPHLLAYALVDTLSQQGEREEIFRYAAGGFRDFTRIASSDPVMWRDIFLANGAATVRILDEFMSDLQDLREVVLREDGEQLFKVFTRAKASREKFLALLEQSKTK